WRAGEGHGPLNDGPDHTLDPLIERYLDGLLEGEQLAKFEEAAGRDAALRERLELQASIDRSLGRLFTYPAPEPAREQPPTPAHRPLPVWQRPVSWRHIAAVLVLGAAVVVAMNWPQQPPPAQRMEPLAVYRNLKNAGWPVEFECKTEREFAEVMQTRMGHPLYVPAETPGVVVAGWSYSSGYTGSPLGPTTMYLITRVDQQPVVVMIDKAEHDRELCLPRGSDLHLYRVRIQDIVIYEISPLKAPRVTESLQEMPR
ncbi:MAG: hypothetical protein ACOYN0_02895, partial [Phycisphaerales bacterium]